MVKVSATRKRRFPIQSLRSREIELFFKEEDLNRHEEDEEDLENTDDHDIYNEDSD